MLGAPKEQWQRVQKHIEVGPAVLLHKDAKVVMWPYVAVSDPWWKLEKDVWNTVGKGWGFPAQVRVQAQGAARRLVVRGGAMLSR